jgi:NAD/NADP transhydrogenase alpha subunit
MNKTIYLRAESKGMEAISALTPTTVRELVANGFELIVERSQQRAISDDNVCWRL